MALGSKVLIRGMKNPGEKIETMSGCDLPPEALQYRLDAKGLDDIFLTARMRSGRASRERANFSEL